MMQSSESFEVQSNPAEAEVYDALTMEGIERRFGDRVVLDHVDLRVAHGEVVALIGRSGSGKSTLVNIASALDRADAGRVWVGETDLHGLEGDDQSAFRLRRIGVVFQHFNLIPDLTVAENVALPLHLAGRKKGSKDRALKLLRILGLEELAAQFPETLSGGEMQRVSIARALAMEPLLILADEPTASVDEAAARTVLQTFRQAAELGAGVLIASHDPLVREQAHRIISLEDGRITEESVGGAGAAPSPRTGAGSSNDSTDDSLPADGVVEAPLRSTIDDSDEGSRDEYVLDHVDGGDSDGEPGRERVDDVFVDAEISVDEGEEQADSVEEMDADVVDPEDDALVGT